MIICAAKCRHRAGDGCALERSGMAIILNGVGQCELKEEPVSQPTLTARACTMDECELLTMRECLTCGTPICADHGIENPEVHMTLCTTCWLRYGPDLGEESDDYDTDGTGSGSTGPSLGLA